MSRSDGLCEFCPAVATVAIYAKGYPAAQAITCAEHVQAWKDKDSSAPGSTGSWDLIDFDPTKQERPLNRPIDLSALPGSGLV
jgi:hypothetical protein